MRSVIEVVWIRNWIVLRFKFQSFSSFFDPDQLNVLCCIIVVLFSLRKLSTAFSFNLFGTESVVFYSEVIPFSESDNGICKAMFCCFMIPVPGDLLYKV